MAELTTVSFGPQHPVLPEPIHLDLELKDEKVVRAVPSIGYASPSMAFAYPQPCPKEQMPQTRSAT